MGCAAICCADLAGYGSKGREAFGSFCFIGLTCAFAGDLSLTMAPRCFLDPSLVVFSIVLKASGIDAVGSVPRGKKPLLSVEPTSKSEVEFPKSLRLGECGELDPKENVELDGIGDLCSPGSSSGGVLGRGFSGGAKFGGRVDSSVFLPQNCSFLLLPMTAISQYSRDDNQREKDILEAIDIPHMLTLPDRRVSFICAMLTFRISRGY